MKPSPYRGMLHDPDPSGRYIAAVVVLTLLIVVLWIVIASGC
jgi:hypothetical protein